VRESAHYTQLIGGISTWDPHRYGVATVEYNTTVPAPIAVNECVPRTPRVLGQTRPASTEQVEQASFVNSDATPFWQPPGSL